MPKYEEKKVNHTSYDDYYDSHHQTSNTTTTNSKTGNELDLLFGEEKTNQLHSTVLTYFTHSYELHKRIKLFSQMKNSL